MEGKRRRNNLQIHNLYISGPTPNCIVSLYSIAGCVLARQEADQSGILSLPLGQYLNGIIIVKANSQSFKIIRRQPY